MKLLYAEDEVTMSEAVSDILRYYKFTVDSCYDGEEALALARLGDYDGIILDVMMPKMSGIEVLKTLRDEGCKTPILLLTAKTKVEDKIEGLDLGADDYLSKPFVMGELIARVRAMLRRREDFKPDILQIGNLKLNMQRCEMSVGEKKIVLPNLEYKMLEVLMINQGTYLSTEDLLIKVWGYNTDADIGIVWVYITYLRKKLASLEANVFIEARRNTGYILKLKND